MSPRRLQEWQPRVDELCYYKLPWDEKMAKALREAIGENERQHGSGVGMGQPFERGWDPENPNSARIHSRSFPTNPGKGRR